MQIKSSQGTSDHVGAPANTLSLKYGKQKIRDFPFLAVALTKSTDMLQLRKQADMSRSYGKREQRYVRI
jgi:hypothetical protein